MVVIFQENRTPDNLFQGLCAANGGVRLRDRSGSTTLPKAEPTRPAIPIQLKKVNLAVDYDLDHSHTAFNRDVRPELDRTMSDEWGGPDSDTCDPGATDCPAPDLQFGYVDPTEVQPYFQMAEQYTFADRMFQTNQGPSMPAHQFIISGTSAPSAGSNLFASENPNMSGAPDAGCDAPAGSTVRLIDPTGSETSNAPIYPCFEHPTLTDLLEAKGLILALLRARSGHRRRYTGPRRSGTVRKRSSISADRTCRRPMAPPAWERIGPTM